MEATGTAEGLLEKIRPPRLEDAGVEDCALPPDSITEAFLKAATAVRSRAASFLSPSGEEELDGDCVNDPWPTAGDSSDEFVGITPEAEPQWACPVEKGGSVMNGAVDDVTIGGVTYAEGSGDKVVGTDVPEEGEACVDGFQGLKIGEKGKRLKNANEDEEEGERPILTEA